MVEATFRIEGSDFNSDLIERIKMLLNGDIKNFEIQIRVKTKRRKHASLRVETRQAYFARLEKSLQSVQNSGELVTFENVEDFELFAQKLRLQHAENTI